MTSSSADIAPLVSRNAARSSFAAALSLYVGRGRRYSVKQLANATGVKDRTIECAKCDPDSGDYREPEMAAMLSLAAFLGPEFTTEWLRLAGQGAFTLPDVDDTPPGVLAADNCDDSAVIVRAASDGQFCRAERPGLSLVGKRMMARGAHLDALARMSA